MLLLAEPLVVCLPELLLLLLLALLLLGSPCSPDCVVEQHKRTRLRLGQEVEDPGSDDLGRLVPCS